MGKSKKSKSGFQEENKGAVNWTQIIVAIITFLIAPIAVAYIIPQLPDKNTQVATETNSVRIVTPIETVIATSVPSPIPTITLSTASLKSSCPEGMVYIPEGEFILGSDDEDAPANEKPSHRIYLDAYCIDKTEVSNAAYSKFIAETHPGQSHPDDDLPVINVTWYQADEYCRWKSNGTEFVIKLPSEYQWEKAARGLNGRTYPWEGDWDENKANAGTGKTALVSVYAYDDVEAAYDGLLNMAGNASEWTEDWYQEKMYDTLFDGMHNPSSPIGFGIAPTKVIRGGYYGSTKLGVRSSARDGSIPANLSFDFIGFRCATAYFPP